MATPKKNANGKWETLVYVGINPKTGKKKYKHLWADSKPELVRKMREMEDESTDTIDALSQTVGDVVDAYIARRKTELSPSTIANYKKYRREAFAELMPVRLSQLTDSVCQSAIDKYAEGHAPKTVANRWGLICAAVKEAKKNWNVAVHLPPVKRKRLKMPDEQPLLNLFKEIENTPLEIPVLLAALCGLRRSEICALNFAEDVDYTTGMIRVNKALVMDEDGEYIYKDPKSDAGERAVPCPAWVLEKLKAARDDPHYVRWQANTITCKFTPVAKQLGVNCSFHGLRHYYASLMSALNVPEQYAMERMGHSTNYMLKRYQEYIRSKEAEVNEDLMNALDSLNPYSSETTFPEGDNVKDNVTPSASSNKRA